MSEPKDPRTTATDAGESAPPSGLIVLGSADGAADAGDAGECADGFCAL